MKKEELFTIILSNYNQEKYIFETIDSVLDQNYREIELIISDDCSAIFPKDKILKYINKKRDNLKVMFVVNKSNLGTVKTYNKCLKLSTGKYVAFIAGDDKYHDKNVISNFVKKFQENKEIEVVTSITQLYDENFKVKMDNFPFEHQLSYFDLKPMEQNRKLMNGPFFAPGATAYKLSLFKKMNYFDEVYKLIEDWSFFLRITKNETKIYYANFVSLLHRGGGVSESAEISTYLHKSIIKDTKKIYDIEIFPQMKKLTAQETEDIMSRFKLFIFYNRRLNLSILFDYIKQVMLSNKYKKVLFRRKKLEILSTIITLITITLFYKILHPYILIFIPIILYIISYKVLKKITTIFSNK